jgi:hypothetical protein
MCSSGLALSDAGSVHTVLRRGLGGQRYRHHGAALAHIADADFGDRQGSEARQAR